MARKFCDIHPGTKLVVYVYCPRCRGKRGGASTAKTMSAAERKRRARKAAQARWKTKKGKTT